ncbi:hypothetical protein FGRMN_3546 [Fusarium graminum]|nr:hypothetical protein FGRMN_3546 [Fusarium graminum]
MAMPFKVKAIYEYSSPHEDDLNFGIGQVITVTEEEDADWYGGEYQDDQGVKHEGIFPRNFVEKFEPTAPPRPARTRTKKEPEAAQPVEDITSPPPPPVQQAPPPVPAPEPEPEIEEAQEPIYKHSAPEPPAPAVPEHGPSKPAESAPVAAPPPTTAPKAVEPPAPAPAPAQAQVPAAASPKPKPSVPPPVTGKPSTNSFRDRIAAFNKPAAPPVAPFKPSGLAGTGTGFVKKPFVAPPPSRNAFIPPPQQTPTAKVYRRDEDPEIKEREAETQGQAERAGLVPTEGQGGEGEDQPKPTSLKERIALLQKQQQEQAARHADAVAKKEKPKKPQKKRESIGYADAPAETEASPQEPQTPLERTDTQDTEARKSIEEPQPSRMPPPPRRRSSKGPAAEPVHDGNEADMSGAGDTTEGADDVTEREDSDNVPKPATQAPSLPIHAGPPPEAPRKEESEEVEDEEEEEEEMDPEVRRKEELRARMAKMSGGMGFHGMFGAPKPAPTPPPKKKKAPKPERASIDEAMEDSSPASYTAPPVPAMMPLPGFGGLSKPEESTKPEAEHEPATRAPPPPVPSQPARPVEHEEAEEKENDSEATPAPHSAPTIPPREPAAPPVPGSRGAPPPVPAESRPPPPAPPADVRSQSDGSESGDELSGGRDSEMEPPVAIRSPPMAPPPVQPPHLPARSPPLSPAREDFSPTSPGSNASNRLSRLPPSIPGSAPAPPAQSRPPPPPPPGVPRRQSTQDSYGQPPRGPPQAGEEEAEELTEYEGDYDTDIGSSVPHKDALKSHARDSSVEDNTLLSPTSDAPPPSLPPPIPTGAPPRAVPPPVPSQPPPENKRQSVDIPRAAPPPPPPTENKRQSIDVPRAAPPPPPPVITPQPPQSTLQGEEYDQYNYSAPPPPGGHYFGPRTPKIEEEAIIPGSPSIASPVDRRAPPSVPIGRVSGRQSLDISKATAGNRRSMDMHRPSMSMESGFIANDVDLAIQSGWWKQANQIPPSLQGRKDIYFEADESTSTNGGQKTTITRQIFILYQDYSQTFLTIRYDPYDPSDVELEQRHESPPRPLRQDQMEEFYERFGRHISAAVATKKDSVVADGTPQGLVLELLRPYKDALPPVGTRAYGALVYSNMANASTQQNDMIRAGDIITIRNAKFQGKHGPMHAKYSAEVGKPDHVAVVFEWDGTKKKVRAWEQGRESKKVKVESFKLDDLRSGEVKIWRVMPRSWVGWNSQP